jgi:hypothetical protein
LPTVLYEAVANGKASLTQSSMQYNYVVTPANFSKYGLNAYSPVDAGEHQPTI